jgi:Putative mono-oxygenase ydhR
VIVRLVLWNLADAPLSVAELREYLRDESVPAFAEAPGLRLKLWISDETTARWGAVYLFESREAADAPLSSRVRELVGKDPDLVEEFDLEASVEGRYAVEELGRRGLAFEA